MITHFENIKHNFNINTFGLILAIIIIISACEKNSFNDSYDFLYGDWTPEKVDAGINFSPTDFCEILRFKSPNDYSLFIDDIKVENGIFEIIEQTSQVLRIEFIPKKRSENYNPITGLYSTEIYITAYYNDSIRIYNTVTDIGYVSIWFNRK